MPRDSQSAAHRAHLAVRALRLAGGMGVLLSAIAADGFVPGDDLDRAEFDVPYRSELESLAVKCDELGLKPQAVVSREWFVPRDPRRHYLFLPPARDPTRLAADAAKLEGFWHNKFTRLRQEQARRLFDLARRHAKAGREGSAYRLLHEVLHEDPDHAEARRILGYRRSDGAWRRPFRRPKRESSRRPHPLLGWPPDQYWRVESEHFQVATNVSVRAGRKLAGELERIHAVWQQLFYEYWTVPGRLTARFSGQDNSLGPPRTFQVVLFRDRDDYVRQLSRFERRIAASIGYYSQGNKTAFFYEGDKSVRMSWVHEATHQFFQESGQVAPRVAEHSNFWVVEGVALYMESLADRGSHMTTGGVEADRLQYARFRALNGDYYVPLAELVAYGREQVQKHKEIRRLYSQSAGLAHFFMHDSQGAMMRPFIEYLRVVYRGVAQPPELSRQIGVDYAHLDQRYRTFLDVADEDLAFVDHDVRNLCLGHTAITDKGLAYLRGCTNLRWLDLSFTSAGDAGLAGFSDARQLEQLNLEKTAITDRGLEVIRDFRQLEELDISRTAIGDDGLKHLAKLTRLKVLWLTATRVTDLGLASLSSLRNLERLDIEGTRVTREGFERLKKRLPKIN